MSNTITILYHQIDSATIGLELQTAKDSIHMQIPAGTAPQTIRGISGAIRKTGDAVTVQHYQEQVQ